MPQPRAASTTSATDLLAHANALVEAGEFAQAIDLLTRSVRAERCAQLERELIAVRHRAALARLATPTTAPPLPEPGACPPTDTWPPAIDRDELTAALLHSSIKAHGCLLVRRLLSRERAATFVEAIDRALAGYDARAAGADDPSHAVWYEPFVPRGSLLDITRSWLREGGGVLMADSPRAFFDILDTYDEIGLLDIIGRAIGERPLLSLDKSTLRRVAHGDGIEWHQDGAFLGADIRAVNVWAALTHAGADAPGLDIVPTRLDRIVPTGSGDASFSWSVGTTVIDETRGALPIARPVFEPGDALLFDGMLLHRTSSEPGMIGVRYAIESWFFAPSTFPSQQRFPLYV